VKCGEFRLSAYRLMKKPLTYKLVRFLFGREVPNPENGLHQYACIRHHHLNPPTPHHPTPPPTPPAHPPSANGSKLSMLVFRGPL